jgi:hypothetical protein
MINSILKIATIVLCASHAMAQRQHDETMAPKGAVISDADKNMEEFKVGRHGKSFTILKSMKWSEATVEPPSDAAVVGSVGGKKIYKVASPEITKDNSHYIGVVYQNDTKDIGLLSKEISVKFTTEGVPEKYKNYRPKEIVKGAGIYIVEVINMKQWQELMLLLQNDSGVVYANPRVVVGEKRAQ